MQTNKLYIPNETTLSRLWTQIVIGVLHWVIIVIRESYTVVHGNYQLEVRLDQ